MSHSKDTEKRQIGEVTNTSPPVTTKQDFYQRFYAGEFGNHGPMWCTWMQYEKSQYHGLIAIRTLRPGGLCYYNLTKQTAFDHFYELLHSGWGPEFNFSAMAPTHRTLLQGELSLTTEGLYLFWSGKRLPMREALTAHSMHHSGATVNWLLREYCDPDSYDWLMHLLTEYPDHVIEFSVYECCWGVIPNRNTVIWEVRKY